MLSIHILMVDSILDLISNTVLPWYPRTVHILSNTIASKRAQLPPHAPRHASWRSCSPRHAPRPHERGMSYSAGSPTWTTTARTVCQL
jgi:hypothetical protein